MIIASTIAAIELHEIVKVITPLSIDKLHVVLCCGCIGRIAWPGPFGGVSARGRLLIVLIASLPCLPACRIALASAEPPWPLSPLSAVVVIIPM
eukprot:2821844-Amphidinium_carterae.1